MSSEGNEVKWAAAWRACCIVGRFAPIISRLANVVEIDPVTSRTMDKNDNQSNVLVERDS
jgi:hypothetical protein